MLVIFTFLLKMDFSKIFVLFILVSASQAKRVEKAEIPENATEITEETIKLWPGTVFFDLDFTLWPYWVDTTAVPPFKKDVNTGEVVDYKGKVIKYFPEVPKVFNYLENHHISIGICSSSIAVNASKQLIDLFGWTNDIKIIEIYPISKDISLTKMKETQNLVLQDILFFDDEPHIHRRLKHIKVVSYPVINGMTMKDLMFGLQKYSDVRTKKIKL